MSFAALSETEQLTATVMDQTGAEMPGASVTWVSSEAQTASVSTTGLVTALANGASIITATSGSASTTAAVTVAQAPASILLSPSSVVLAGPGDTVTVAATVLDAGGSAVVDSEPIWSSDDEAVATVGSAGLVTAVASGLVTIRVEVASDGQPVTDALPVTIEGGVPTGPGGGQVSLADDAVNLDFPAGALMEPVFITAEPATNLPAGGEPIAGTAFDFGPDGIVFAEPVTLTISYDPADVPLDVPEADLRLHELVDGGYVLVDGSTVDVADQTVSGVIQGFSVFAVLQRLGVTTTSLPNAAPDVVYSETLAATGGGGSYTWVLATGSLPAGLSLAANGDITGTPTTEGTSNFTVEVTDGTHTAQQELSITVHPLLAVTTASLPNAAPSVPYSETLAATGGYGGYTWAVVGGSLPTGLSLSTNGDITGTPTGSGPSNFTVEVTSGDGQTAQRALSITVTTVLGVFTASLPDGVEDMSYGTQALVATGGDGSYTWAVLAGSLPTGLSLSTNGDITGTPTGSGTSNFTVEVTSGDGQTAQRALSITVHALLAVTTTSLPKAAPSVPYSETLAATGGDGGYTWAVFAGSPPTGLSLSPNGDITGTPTGSGTSNFTVEVTSGDGQTAQRALSITVRATLAVTTTSLPDGAQDVGYGTESLAAAGGDGSYTWAVVGGSLPTGLSLSTNGDITATPTGAGTSNFTVRVTSGDGQTAQRALSITIIGPPAQLTVLTQPSSSAQSGVEFGQQPVVEVRDAGGNPIGGFDVTAAGSSGGGTLGGNTTVLTDGSGVATFTGLSLTGSVGGHTLSFTAGSASTQSNAITLQVGPPASVVVLTQPSSTAQSGVVFGQQASVEVRDGGGNPVGGVDVDASIASGGGTLGGGTTVTTDGAGRATFGGQSLTGSPGVRTLRFQAGSASVVSQSIDLTPGPPALVTIVTQPSSSAQSGVPFGQQPVIEVRDGDGNLVSGVDVDVSVASGAGTLGGGTTVTTNGVGRATFSDLTITGSSGVHTLRFQAGTASVVSGSINLSSGVPTLMTILTQPSSSARSGVSFGQQPVIEVRDDGGNPTAGFNVTAVISSGGGTLGGTTTVLTDGSGVATFTELSITGLVGDRTLGFSSGSASIESGTVVLEAGPPASVLVLTEPSPTALSGVVLGRQPSVEVRDDVGNLVGGVDVDASIASGGGGLGGGTTVSTNGSGTATFTNMSITGSPGSRTLRFASDGAQASSNAVSVAYSQGTYLNVQYCGSLTAQRMDVYVPNNTISRPVPVAAFIHGGGWTSGDKSNGLLLTEVRDELLSRGYVVVSLNYRLATPSTNQWPAQIHDVKCAIRHLRAEAGDYGFDGARIGVWGVSAGAHLTSMLGVTDAGSGFEGSEGFAGWSSSVKATVSVGGISDLTQDPDHPELNFNGKADTFNSWPGPSTELTNASPITWASVGDPPFLIVHGDKDTVVFPAQATRLRDFLASAGASVTLQLVTNGGHNLDDVGSGTPSPTIAQITQQIANFLDTHVRFNP